jgi:predicted GTPase
LPAQVLKRGIPVRVAVNKCESEKTGQASAAEFWKLGLGEPNAVSAIHGVGTAELLEGVFEDIERLEGAGKQGVQVEERDKEVEDFLMDYGIGGDDAKGDDDGFNQLSKREQRKVARMKDR